MLLAYAVMRPLVLASQLPTRGGLPLAMGLICRAFHRYRKKALTQVVGFLVLENGIALMAVLGTFGIPLIVELGVFLDVMMAFSLCKCLSIIFTARSSPSTSNS